MYDIDHDDQADYMTNNHHQETVQHQDTETTTLDFRQLDDNKSSSNIDPSLPPTPMFDSTWSQSSRNNNNTTNNDETISAVSGSMSE